VPSGHPHG